METSKNKVNQLEKETVEMLTMKEVIEPNNFPQCPSCNSNHDVDVDEIDEVFVCRNCGIQWNGDSNG